MNREPVSSSNISSVGYDSGKKILEVEFNNGGVFQYQGVLPEEHVRLVNAGKPGWSTTAGESVGKYFHANIKRRYPSKKVPPQEVAP